MSEDTTYDLLLSNIREIAKTKQGQAFIWHILDFCGIYTDSFTGDNQTFYLEGKRSIGLSILQLLEDADPSIYPRLVLLNNEEKDNATENSS